MNRMVVNNDLDVQRLMTCEEVANFLQVNVSTIRRWCRTNMLKGYKVGQRGDWRFNYDDVLSMLSQGN